jgi:uncharacterized protein YaiL (DUF2058 family)
MASEHAVSGLVIGIGSPNRACDGRIVQCAIAVTEELGLIRFFADYRGKMSKVSVWDRCLLRLQRSEKDNRDESYKLVEVEVIDKITCSFEKRIVLNSLILKSEHCDPID